MAQFLQMVQAYLEEQFMSVHMLKLQVLVHASGSTSPQIHGHLSNLPAMLGQRVTQQRLFD